MVELPPWFRILRWMPLLMVPLLAGCGKPSVEAARWNRLRRAREPKSFPHRRNPRPPPGEGRRAERSRRAEGRAGRFGRRKDLLNAASNNANWLMYGRTYNAHRYSPLNQINKKNVTGLVPVWTFQTGVLDGFECTPLIIDGIMYITTPWNHAYAIDCKTGSQIWHYQKSLPENMALCCDAVNRGFAASGDRLYMTTLDAHLVCLDRNTGEEVWDTEITINGDDGKEIKRIYKLAYSATVAPLVIKDKVIMGISGAEYGIRGFIDAYDAKTGKRVWRFYTVPERRGQVRARQEGPGHLGRQIVDDRRRLRLGHRHLRSRSSTRSTGASAIPRPISMATSARATIFTPAPSWPSTRTTAPTNGTSRTARTTSGITTASMSRCWWTSNATARRSRPWCKPIAMATSIASTAKTAQFIYGKPFCEVTWTDRKKGADGLDPKTGRPFVNPAALPTDKGVRVCPGAAGGKEWNPMAYHPGTGLPTCR